MTHEEMPGTCSRRPYPGRCGGCPAIKWPSAGVSDRALQAWAQGARCPHDYLGGVVAWEQNAHEGGTI